MDIDEQKHLLLSSFSTNNDLTFPSIRDTREGADSTSLVKRDSGGCDEGRGGLEDMRQRKAGEGGEWGFKIGY